MPNYIDLFSGNYRVNYNPLNKLAVDPNAFVGQLPLIVQLYEQGQEFLLNLLNNIIPQLNALFGINLPDATTLVNAIKTLLKGFNLLSSGKSFLEQLIAALGGIGSDLTAFFNAVSALFGGGISVQSLIDAIANALGHPGTGHTILQIIGYLEAIPFQNILSIFGLANLGADIQKILDTIENALGVSGSNHVIADLLAILQAIPFANILSVFGLSSLGADVQAIIDKGLNALGVAGTGHTLATWLATLQAIPNINITSIFGLASLGADVQAVIDKGLNALGVAGTGHTLATWLATLGAIPFGNILSVLGLANLGADVQAILDTVFGVALNTSSTGNSLAGLKSALLSALHGLIPSAIDNGDGTSTAIGSNITARNDGTSILAPIVGSNLNQLLQNLDGTTVSLATALQSLPNLLIRFQTAIDSIANAANQGNNIGNDVAFIETALGLLPGGNVLGYGGPATSDHTHQATWDALWQAITGGTATGNGLSLVQSVLAAMAASVSSSVTTLNNTVLNQSAAFAPAANTQQFSASGTYTVPTFMVSGDMFDIIVLGDGGGAHGAGFALGNTGAGFPGVYTAITLVYGTDIPTSTHSFTVTVGTGGAGGLYGSPGNGSAGSGSSVSITGYASSPITAAGGAGGVAGLNTLFGQGPGNEAFNSQSYPGGVAGNVRGAPGNAPGGAGSSGQYTNPGGAGAPGAVWVRAYKAGGTTIPGSGFRACNESLTAVNGLSGANIFPSGFFSTITSNTADFTPSSPNKVTVGVAGWYKVRIRVNCVGMNKNIGLLLYQNGSIADYSQTAVYNNVNNTPDVSEVFTVLCAANDTLQPGYNLAAAVTSAFVGEASGLQNFWSVSLMNRSLA